MTQTSHDVAEQYRAVEPSLLGLLRGRRGRTVGAILVAGLAVVVALDWPHAATTGQQRADFTAFATQIRGDVQSCGLEVEQTLSAYNQVTAGVVADRGTAAGIAAQTALDCTPLGNSRVDELGAIQPPQSLHQFGLASATTQLYDWCFPAAVDLAQDVQQLLAHPGDPRLLADLRTKLTQMSAEATIAQQVFDSAATKLGGNSSVAFGLDEVRPGVLVG